MGGLILPSAIFLSAHNSCCFAWQGACNLTGKVSGLIFINGGTALGCKSAVGVLITYSTSWSVSLSTGFSAPAAKQGGTNNSKPNTQISGTRNLYLSTGMMLLVRGFDAGSLEMRIDLRGREVRMPEQFLHGTQVGS